MIIAMVSDTVYPYFKGGKEKRIYELSTRLVKMGHEVHIYTMKWWEGPDSITEVGVHLHAICKLHPIYSGERRSIKEGLLFGIACLKLIRIKFDVIDVDHMPFFPLYSVWIICKLKNSEMFATWSEVWGRKYWVEYMGISGNISSLIEHVSVRLPTKIISVSPHTVKLLREVLHYKGNIIIVPNGIDFKKIQSVQASKNKSDVLYAGRLLKHKRLDLLIQAVSILKMSHKKFLCIIIGEGPERKRLEKFTNNLGVNEFIEFRNFYNKEDDVYAHMKASKVIVSPSEREGFGIVAIEANACGRTVVTNSTSRNATKDLITEGTNGFLFNKSAESMVEKLEIALEKYSNLEKKCIAFAREFDWDMLAKQLSEAYSK